MNVDRSKSSKFSTKTIKLLSWDWWNSDLHDGRLKKKNLIRICSVRLHPVTRDFQLITQISLLPFSCSCLSNRCDTQISQFPLDRRTHFLSILKHLRLSGGKMSSASPNLLRIQPWFRHNPSWKWFWTYTLPPMMAASLNGFYFNSRW